MKKKGAFRKKGFEHSRHPILFRSIGAVIDHQDAQPVITRKSALQIGQKRPDPRTFVKAGDDEMDDCRQERK